MIQSIQSATTPMSIPGAQLEIYRHEDVDYFYCREHNDIKPFYVAVDEKVIPTCEDCFLDVMLAEPDIGKAAYEE